MGERKGFSWKKKDPLLTWENMRIPGESVERTGIQRRQGKGELSERDKLRWGKQNYRRFEKKCVTNGTKTVGWEFRQRGFIISDGNRREWNGDRVTDHSKVEQIEGKEVFGGGGGDQTRMISRREKESFKGIRLSCKIEEKKKKKSRQLHWGKRKEIAKAPKKSL